MTLTRDLKKILKEMKKVKSMKEKIVIIYLTILHHQKKWNHNSNNNN